MCHFKHGKNTGFILKRNFKELYLKNLNHALLCACYYPNYRSNIIIGPSRGEFMSNEVFFQISRACYLVMDTELQYKLKKPHHEVRRSHGLAHSQEI